MCACYHPRRIFYTGRKTESGAKEGILTNGFINALSLETAAKKLPGLKLSDCKAWTKEVNGKYFLTFYDEIPCGKCEGCKIDYSRDWATRIVLEAGKYGQDNAFITFTYDDNHLPKDRKISKREVQLLLKRIRKHYGNEIKVAYSGEYGSITKRPHYHMLLMNIRITDKVKLLQPGLFTSPTLERIWGKGNISIGEVTYNSAAYVARYVLKKHDDEDCFFGMSRRPGIAHDYYVKNGQMFANGKIYTPMSDKPLNIPKYFKRKFKEEDPETSEFLAVEIKDSMEAKNRQLEKSYSGLGSREKILSAKEEMQKRKTKRLKRPLV